MVTTELSIENRYFLKVQSSLDFHNCCTCKNTVLGIKTSFLFVKWGWILALVSINRTVTYLYVQRDN